MELDYAALQQLCSPMLEFSERLPDPQRDALGVAFGLSAGQAPSPFLVGLAVLGLLSEAAEQQPLLCVVDDAQWLDGASARALAFVARRLLAERIALVFGTRDAGRWTGPLPAAPRGTVGPSGCAGAVGVRASRRGWTRPCSSGSSPRPAGIRSRSWSFRAG